MNLLTATTRYYLTLSALLFVLGGGLLYAGLQWELRREVDEQLLNQQRFLERNPAEAVPARLPFAGQVRVQRVLPAHLGFADTLLLDPLEQEVVPHRQLTFRLATGGAVRWVTLRKSLLETEDILEVLAVVLGLLLALLLLCGVGLHRWLTARLWAPFRQTLAALRTYDLARHQALLLPDASITEFAELNHALRQMSARLEADYHALKEFTENAAHETRTPLAIMQARLEQLMQLPALADPTAAPLLRDLYGATLRLTRLQQGLSLLTRIENRQFAEATPVPLAPLLREKLDQLQDFIENKALEMKLVIDASPTLRLHPALADSLVSNLLQNAIRHNHAGGTLRVVVSANSLTMENTGPALPPGTAPTDLFARFRKLRPTSDSPGLGLAIVQQICELYGFELTYHVLPDPVRHHLRVGWTQGAPPATPAP